MNGQIPKNIVDRPFDLIVIGAGVNGAGIARDAAMRGLSVLLLDKGDIGGGTSSWSTRLIHGGLRYLEHGELGLVRESLRERDCLLKIAPHLVRPLQLLVPIYENARRGLWTMRAGMLAYDVLSFDKKLPRYRMLSRAETLGQAPGLNPDGLVGAAVYYDAQVEFAERLVLENALSALEHGAMVLTYARVDKLIVEDGEARGVRFTQEHRGSSPNPDTGTADGSPADRDSTERRHSATARVVINAAGPWIDELLADSIGNAPRLIGGTKGSHLIVAPFPGAPASALYVEAETDHRPFFIIPWNGHYLIGTTDARYTGDLDQVQVKEEEIDYLLRETNRVIPGAGLSRREILYTYSGVRPLPFTGGGDGGNSGNRDAANITRRHFIRPHHQIDNLLSIVGGKLTTYRNLAEETVDLLFKKLGRNAVRCSTDRVPLPGATPPVATSDFLSFIKDFKHSSRLSPGIIERLLRVYGTRAAAIVKLVADDCSLAEVFDAETQAIAAEVVYSFEHELAETLADCLLRRTMVGLNSTRGLNAVEAAAKIVQKYLGWSKAHAEQEVAEYQTYVARFRALG